MENCIFCKIIKGEIPSYKVWEDENNFAFLTIQPHTEGHTLVLPKKHVDYFFDLEDSDLANLTLASKKVADKLKDIFKPASGKIGVVVAGLEVAHAHVHLIPLHNEGDLDLSKARSATPEELAQTLEKIQLV